MHIFDIHCKPRRTLVRLRLLINIKNAHSNKFNQFYRGWSNIEEDIKYKRENYKWKEECKMAKSVTKKPVARRNRKNIDRGSAHIHSSFNNTIDGSSLQAFV